MKIRSICRRGIFILITFLLMVPAPSFARHPLEMYPVPDEMYVRKWCADQKGATMEVAFEGRRVLFELAPKWSEAIGRALYYSFETGKKAGIVLIIDDQKNLEQWRRLNATIQHFELPIDTWKME